MKIAKDTVVSLHYTLSDAEGNQIDKSKQPMVYLHGGYGNTLPKIEAAMEGKDTGYTTTINVEPSDAFGYYDEQLVKVEPRKNLPAQIEVGMQFEGRVDAEDNTHSVVFTVTEFNDEQVTLDGNHPLAGLSLRFALNVTDVRAATTEEISHGHVHGPHGHHH
ncbi:FKBP-type peptidyl-prolyl cis-trans isomerase [Noviherbaspirillum sp. Root189]|uniref:FKBP-type peptidyl-prolyl cis-trans isomerase n=1 Tax=Noviherbaspirillum sp. Root189 TaxID=1736487 RepID=UPI00070979D2|nr:peptidylprolyl isomerase [Noviherbaspirillum sp. Root189]KRB70615.1 peptidylprolyl isomerase [Noviherbaspirillum sp. Root189]